MTETREEARVRLTAEFSAGRAAILGKPAGRGERARPRDLEGAEQRALFKWAEHLLGRYPELADLHHIPNGGRRDKATAAKLKAEGVRAGVSDLALLVPHGPYHGLVIELKVKGGAATPAQLAYIERRKAAGYRALVCFGWVEASEAILAYLALGPFRSAHA